MTDLEVCCYASGAIAVCLAGVAWLKRRQPVITDASKINEYARRKNAGGARRALAESRRDVFQHAIDHKLKVRIAYLDAEGNETTRVIEPTDAHDWQVRAWCELRDDMREFMYNRMLSVEILS